MKTRSKAAIGIGAGLAVMAGIVVGVQLLDGADGVEAAAEVLPADTTSFTYVNRDAWAERAGIDDIGHDYSEADLDKFSEASKDSAVGTPLAQYVSVMDDAAFNEFDVDWQVTAAAQDGEESNGFWNIYRMDDDLDLGTVIDSMVEAGWSKDDLDGNPRLTIDMSAADPTGMADNYPILEFMDVTIVEDEHLMIASGDPEQVLDVIEGDADSLADNDDLDEMLGQVDDVEFADVRLGDQSCAGPGGRPMTQEQQAQLAETDFGALGTADATGYFQEADGDDASSVGVLVFSSDDSAEEDAEARETWLRDGLDPQTQTPMDDPLDLDGVEADGRVVVARGTFESERFGVQMSLNRSGLTACNASN